MTDGKREIALGTKFYQRYDGADIRTRKKVRLLAPAAAVIGLFALLLGALMAITGAVIVAIMMMALAVFCGLILFFVIKGRYQLASSLFVYGLFAVMFAAIKFDEYVSVYECYVFGTLGSFLLITTGLLATSRVHVHILTLLNLAAIALLYVVDSLPLEGVPSALAIQSLGTSGVLVLAGGMFSSFTVKMQRVLVDECVLSSEAARLQFEKTTAAVQNTQEAAASVSASLSSAAHELAVAARELQDVAADEAKGVSALDEVLELGEASERMVAAGQERLGSALSAYSAKVLEASASVAQMLMSLREISAAASERSGGVEALAALAKDGDERVSYVAQSIDGIVRATGHMNEMNSLIGDVAKRTNLLGMNASIEAAHAGTAGKGFGVVAEEIRKLSEEASTGSSAIARLLSDTQEAVGKASSAGKETGQFFARMAEEIQRVSNTLGSLLERMAELSTGTAEVSGAIDGFRDLAASAFSAADESAKAMRESSSRSADARNVASGLKASAERVSLACELLLKQAELIQGLGEKNAESVLQLRLSLTKG
ncbi:MAG TPA: hypothetical protein DCG47_14090 [Spirochaetaceae bacterium]|nr:hypothetical protein [Spirochaetaceae bacterium]